MTLSEWIHTRLGFFSIQDILERDLTIVHLAETLRDQRRLSVGIAQSYVELARQFRAHLDDDHELVDQLDLLIEATSDSLSQMEEFST